MIWGEAGLLDMRVSRDVLRETQHVLKRFGDDVLADFAAILDRADFAVTADPSPDTISECSERTGYEPDARIVAAAHQCRAEFLLTYDATHLLGNPLIGPPDTNGRVVTPHECLNILLARLKD